MMSFHQDNQPVYISSSSADRATVKKTPSTKSYQETSSLTFDNTDNASDSRLHKPVRASDKKSSHSKSHHKSSHSKPPKTSSSSTSTHKQSSSKTEKKTSSKSKDKHTPSDTLVTYLEDSTHTNPGYSTTYTQGLINAYGFPEEPAAREDLESEIVREAQAKVQFDIEGMSRLRLE